jgi:hypothetical protein
VLKGFVIGTAFATATSVRRIGRHAQALGANDLESGGGGGRNPRVDSWPRHGLVERAGGSRSRQAARARRRGDRIRAGLLRLLTAVSGTKRRFVATHRLGRY